jgi:autotransporter-associated beta strand protein
MDRRSSIGEAPGIRRSVKRLRTGNDRLHWTRWIVAIFGCLAAVATQAQNATWTPGTSDWNVAGNWSTLTTVPGINDTATFTTASVTTVTFSTAATISTLSFATDAPAYSFHLTGPNITLTIAGTGIVNNSTTTRPTFLNDTLGETNFANGSVASNAMIVNDTGGFTLFSETSMAGTATIVTNSGGNIEFTQTASADHADITTDGGTPVGATIFLDSSTAGNAVLTTNAGGETVFENTSSGGQATVVTNTGGIFDISFLTSGGTTVGSIAGAGTYQLGHNALTVGGNGTSTEVSGTIVDGGINGGTGASLIKVGTGTLILSGANTYTGGTTISDGTLQIGDGFTNGSILGSVTDNATLAFDPVGTVTFGGAISGNGNVVKLGGGAVVLTANNNYLGATTINAGSLEAGSVHAFSPFSAFTVNGELDLHGFSNTIASLAGTGNVTTLLASPVLVTLTAGGDGSSTVFSGIMSDGTGVLAFSKIGPGTMTLSGNNTYSGGTTVVGGVISVGADVNLGNSVGGITLQGGELLTTGDFVTARTIALMPFGVPTRLAATGGTSAVAACR